MTEIQILIIALAPVPTIIAVVVGVLINNARLNEIDAQISGMTSQLSGLHSHVSNRFDEMRDMVSGDLRQFGQRIDARLKHLEER
jgi:hypothetical protein